MTDNHDYKWLANAVKEACNGKQHITAVDIADVAAQYHEHMLNSSAEYFAAFPEFTCVLCNYTFKGPASCKCGNRVTAELRDAILLNNQQSIVES